LIAGCGASNSAEDAAGTDSQMVENAEQTDAEENIATDGVADYPAAIMVNDTVYLVEGNPMPAEVDESAITFTGIIIDHTVASLVPVVCVKTLDEEAIPYEAVIDFEWLYGKLEPGRYRIVKTVTDFRGTGDYTDYVYTAEFSI